MGYAAVKTVAFVEALFTEVRAVCPRPAHRAGWAARLAAGRVHLDAWADKQLAEADSAKKRTGDE
jgi:hypothetical protein